ncbi:hypothetical protein CIL03_07185 [Virgibacillus indicus]|uniref:Cxxc_20_cxxc protein n=1 Tax=Virgibacillus indicus TaxID=2024554 RepID=A0A265NDW2_9BACI|nr:TIGR04104 family putative zinc finger protein [Virgibacillus indicus]OZU89486.1 hypothetical protein CIL03_07185 [Virgibacillus indicus]
MPDCAHCRHEWSYGETLKKSFQMKMVCPYCKQDNYHSARGRKRSMMTSVVLAPAIILFGTFIDAPWLWVILIALVLGMITIAATPFLMELSKEEEPLW